MWFKIEKILKACWKFLQSFIVSVEKDARENRGDFKIRLGLLLLACFGVFVLIASMRPAVKGVCRIILQSEAEEEPSMGMDRLIGIEARRAVLGTTLREVKSIGTLKANAEVVIKSEIPGKISEILFTEGTQVKKGDVLIKFEDTLYKSEREKYAAEYTLKKAEFDRVDKLFKGKVGSKKNYDEAFAQMQGAKAQLDSAEYQLSRTVIHAPFDGTIGIMKGSVTPGNIVQQHTELVDIVDNSVVRVEFSVPVKYINDVAVGQNVEIFVDAFTERVFPGVVDAIDSEIDTKNHSLLVRAVVPNKHGALKHGMFANVKLVTGEKSNVVLIDEDALDREGSIEFVWIVDEKNRAYRKRVLSGAKDINGVEILAGLKEGDIVVTTGQLKLGEGRRVKILNKLEFEEDGKKAKKKPDEEGQDVTKNTEDSENETSSDASTTDAEKSAATDNVKKNGFWNKVKEFFRKKQSSAESDSPADNVVNAEPAEAE
ncbi:MAG: efflux RND transporter periplasmic adaptor subunit [Alphaproteobacteria bacterium]|nr:efflux RND transporter periplasmic adaptor subunit [Alphaproteobacteria bacterium]